MIGRDHPAGVLRAEISRAVESHGGLVLVTGEAGIGKTTLVTLAAEEARARGALVLGGSCWDSDNAPGYWPWTQVVRALRRSHQVTHPALSALLGETTSQATNSFALYDAVTTALVSAAQDRPLVVVLDDLHWADAASLKLLEFAAQHTWFERLVLIGTYRDGEVDEHLMSPLLAKATTVTLTGLDAAEVGELIERTTGAQPDPELVAEMHRRTGGNPFFVEQTARLWHTGSTTTIPPGVRDALQRRMSLLPQPVSDLLTTAAVLGREFHRPVLAATAGAPVAQVDRLLDQAAQARLVISLGGGRFSFVHDLVRETLYENIDDPARWHAAAADAVTEPAEKGRHAYLAGDRVDSAKATDLLVAAARDASDRLATDESIGHFQRAAERAESPQRRVMIALDLGHEMIHNGDRLGGWQVFEDAAQVAREVDDPELLARVALVAYRFKEPSDAVPFLDEAYERMIGTPEPGRTQEELARELSEYTAKLARDGDDDEVLTHSLWATHDVTWGLGNAAERLELTEELIEVARRTGAVATEQFAMSLRWVALLELGNPAYLDQFHAFIALCERAGMPRFTWASSIDRSIITAMIGGFDEAEALLRQADGMAGDHAYPSTMQVHLWWALRMMRGDLDALDAMRPDIENSGYSYPGLLAGFVALRRGDVEAARPHLAEFLTKDERHQRWFEPLWWRFRAELAAASGDRELCEQVRAALMPYRGQWLVSLYGCDVSGPVDLYLGLVEAALGLPSATEKFTAAVESAERMRSRPWADKAREHLGMPLGDNEFRREGPVWTLRFAGRSASLPDAKGLRDLHVLLSRAGVPVSAVSMLDPDAVPSARLGGDDVLDAQAKAAYQHRLSQLDEEIDTASLAGNDNRAAALDRERVALLEELRAAAGLAGRTRRLGDEAERARKAVTARIRDTLRRLDDIHPELAAHLRAAVSTGSTCLYQPAERVHFRL